MTLRRKITLNIDGGISARIIRFPASSPIGLDESTTIESSTKIKSVIKKKNTVAMMHITCTVTKEYGIAIKYSKGNQH
ncbi:hypothetical protein DYY65_04470 [Nitrososphaera sp. AFS]|jgi:hypothetical protein|nr:hypothetical protein [Nitrososphaera sp. AFS]